MVAVGEDMTPEQVAMLLRVSRKSVAAWIKSGELRAYDVSRKGARLPRWRIARESIEAFKMQRAAAPREIDAPASTLSKLPRLAGLLESQIAREEARERRSSA